MVFLFLPPPIINCSPPMPEIHFPAGSVVKKLPANAGDLGLIPDLGRSPGEENGSHSSILAWRIPWTEEPGTLESMGFQKCRSRLGN